MKPIRVLNEITAALIPNSLHYLREPLSSLLQVSGKVVPEEFAAVHTAMRYSVRVNLGTEVSIPKGDVRYMDDTRKKVRAHLSDYLFGEVIGQVRAVQQALWDRNERKASELLDQMIKEIRA